MDTPPPRATESGDCFVRAIPRRDWKSRTFYGLPLPQNNAAAQGHIVSRKRAVCNKRVVTRTV